MHPFDLNNILGGPWGSLGGLSHSLAAQSNLFQQQAGLHDLRGYVPVSVPSPEECKQSEIASKNRRNYERWLARMMREPLNDVTFR